ETSAVRQTPRDHICARCAPSLTIRARTTAADIARSNPTSPIGLHRLTDRSRVPRGSKSETCEGHRDIPRPLVALIAGIAAPLRAGDPDRNVPDGPDHWRALAVASPMGSRSV